MPTDFTCWRRARHLSLVMAAVMFFSPIATLKAQTPTAEAPTGEGTAFDTKYITPDAAFVAYVQPRQILTSPKTEMMPIEVASAAGTEFLGIDAVKIERVAVVVEPPVNGPPQFAIVLQLTEAFDINNLPPQLRQHATKDKVGSRDYFKSGNPMLPSFFMPNDTTLYIATQGMLQKQFAKDKPAPNEAMAKQIATASGNEDLVVLADVQKLLPFIQMGLAEVAEEAPPEALEFLEAPEHIQLADLAVNFTQPGKSHLLLHATSAEGADKLEGLIDKAITMGQAQMKAQSQQMVGSEDPIEAAMGRYGLRMADKAYEPYRPQRQGEKFILIEQDFNDPQGANQMTTLAIIGVLVGLLLPAVQAAREAARRNQGMNNLKQLMLSLHNYHDTFETFPAHASYSADGKPLLSWRVHVLPFIEENALYEQFHLDEPWDSEHNKKLIDQMPAAFLSPNSANTTESGRSNYVAPIGEGFLFDGTETGAGMRHITDGTSNTIALLEVDDEHAVPWTAPEDWEYDEQDPTKGLFGLRPTVGLAAFCDGSVQALVEGIDVETLRALFTRSGGEVVRLP
jgi:type II secretory pathway pseudopilin PulG